MHAVEQRALARHFVQHNRAPIDFMVCMDLVGHRFGSALVPDEVGASLCSRVYHTPEDTPDKLDYGKLAATARWLTAFIRAARVREGTHFIDARLDRVTLDEVDEILAALVTLTADALPARQHIAQLRSACDRTGNLPASRRREVATLVGLLEARLQ